MKFNLEKLSQASLIFIAICLVVLILYTFASFLRPFVFAIIITILLVPYTIKKTDKKPHWSIITFKWVGFLFFVLFVISLVGLFLQDDAKALEENQVEQTFSQKILDYNLDLFGKQIEISKFVNESQLKNLFTSTFDNIFLMLQSFFSQILTIIMFLIFTIPSYKIFVKNTEKKISGKSKTSFLASIHTIEKKLREYLLIKTQVSLLTGFITAIVLYLFGIEYAILFGFLTFILNYIPSIGSFVAVGIVVVFDLLFGNSTLIIWVLLIIVLSLVQFVVGSIIEPKLAGDKLSLSPIVILLSLFFWGYIWGIWGMFFSVPLTLFVLVILESLHVEDFDTKLN